MIRVPPPTSPPTIEAAALDALADALAPRIFERLKKLAAEERERNADDADVLDFSRQHRLAAILGGLRRSAHVGRLRHAVISYDKKSSKVDTLRLKIFVSAT